LCDDLADGSHLSERLAVAATDAHCRSQRQRERVCVRLAVGVGLPVLVRERALVAVSLQVFGRVSVASGFTVVAALDDSLAVDVACAVREQQRVAHAAHLS